MPTELNEIAPEIEQQSSPFFSGDITANCHPMMLDEISPALSELQDSDLVLDDIRAGLEVENTYASYGRAVFRTYDEYRRERLGQGV